MGSCKECYHYEVCRMHYRQKCELTYETEKEVRRAMLKAEKGSPICDHFKDRSRFVELPCKLGNSVFSLNPNRTFHAIRVDGANVELITSQGFIFNQSLIGKTVFLTREEAEQALKEREENA